MPDSLKNYLLVAMPGLTDPSFSQSVVYIHQHDSKGTLGFVINKPLPVRLTDILEHLDIDTPDDSFTQDFRVLNGGPVAQEQGFILHRNPKKWPGDIIDKKSGITVSASKEVLTDLAGKKEKPADVLVILGYSGWGEGQLEQELAQNAWLFAPANPNILFETDHNKRWRAAAALVGVDFNKLSNEVGHA